MKKYIYTTVVALMSSLLTLMLAAIAVCVFIVMPFHKAAVDRGFASWVVTNTATGATKFAWSEPASVEENFFDKLEEPLPPVGGKK